jgi:hypothetical protein
MNNRSCFRLSAIGVAGCTFCRGRRVEKNRFIADGLELGVTAFARSVLVSTSQREDGFLVIEG